LSIVLLLTKSLSTVLRRLSKHPSIIRTDKMPFIESGPVAHFTSVIIVAVGAWLTGSALANTLALVPLPPRYWLFPAIMLVGYAILAQVVKTSFIRRFGD
jgi:P-type Mg2+ transporter